MRKRWMSTPIAWNTEMNAADLPLRESTSRDSLPRYGSGNPIFHRI